MAPLDFKHMTSADYKPGEPDEVKYYAQKRKKQYHGNESVQSADKKPEKYVKPDGKVGVRMVRTDKEVIKKEASILKPTKPSDITKHARTLAKNSGDYERNKKKYIDKARAKVFRMYPKESLNGLMKEESVDEAMSLDQMMRMRYQASASQKKNQKKRDEKEKKSMAAKAAMDMKAKNEATWPDEMPKEEVDVDEALNLQQRMKRSRLMKRLKTRIKIGRQRAMRKMANKKTLEKRSNRQARAQIAKKLTRGIPKGELTFARKKEIEKRLEKPALQQRIKRLAKRMFKDIRKKEVQRKKG